MWIGAKREKTRIQEKLEKCSWKRALGKNIHPDAWSHAFSYYNFTQIETDTDWCIVHCEFCCPLMMEI